MLKLTKNEVRNMCIADQATYINGVCASCGVDPYFYIDDWYNVYDVEDLTASGEPDEDAEPISDSESWICIMRVPGSAAVYSRPRMKFSPVWRTIRDLMISGPARGCVITSLLIIQIPGLSMTI